eukprot:CAMPEP_0175782068 /NCGR_PEP_ID=MMETSP0097-20121207/77591_1 /TAXON_ID=311494 /ORGANISM="Alexandrium monilatum, Strain CCMP3105" /LENGTH=45 /DNA_ID= /DNA_START= /DNA_END= /DNA_ORIENTATION=
MEDQGPSSAADVAGAILRRTAGSLSCRPPTTVGWPRSFSVFFVAA